MVDAWIFEEKLLIAAGGWFVAGAMSLGVSKMGAAGYFEQSFS
jgi:hypothetical protein